MPAHKNFVALKNRIIVFLNAQIPVIYIIQGPEIVPALIDSIIDYAENNVNDIHIIEVDGNYFAQPEGLDEELLEGVCNDLVPMFVESEKSA